MTSTLEQRKKWKEQRKKHREKRRAYMVTYYQKHKQHIIQKRHKWTKENRERNRCYNEARKEIRSAQRWAYQHRQEIFERNDNKCKYCGMNKGLQTHHKHYVNSFDAIEVCCKKCHSKLHVSLR